MQISPHYSPEAELALLKAQTMADDGAWQNALFYLGQALRADTRLHYDASALALAETLTGQNPGVAMAQLSNPATCSQFIQSLVAPPARSWQHNSMPVALLLVFITGLFVMLTLPGSGTTPIALMQEFVQPSPEGTVHTLGGIRYRLFIPQSRPPEQGWPALIALPRRGSPPDSLYSYLARSAQENSILLVVPEHRLYAEPLETSLLPGLNAIVRHTLSYYPVREEGAVLFGVAEGAEILSLYARQHPDFIAGLMTFSATFIHPPDPSYESVYIYGQDDPLLEGSSDLNPNFAQMAEWQEALNYIVMENVGQTLNTSQLPFIIKFIKDFYD